MLLLASRLPKGHSSCEWHYQLITTQVDTHQVLLVACVGVQPMLGLSIVQLQDVDLPSLCVDAE